MWIDRSHRELFWLLVRRDLKMRYAGSTLGGLWNLIHPLIMIAIYMTIFSSLLQDRMAGGAGGAGQPGMPRMIDYGGLNYGVHLVAGLIPWLAFSDVLMRSVGLLIENSGFLKKAAFPPLALFGSVLFNALLINGFGYLAFLALLLISGHAPPPEALAGLVTMTLLAIAGSGLGLILAGLNVFFRDTAQLLTIAMQLLFWFNPIVYPKEKITAAHPDDPALARMIHVGRWILALNPIERFITASQSLFGIVATRQTALDWAILGLFPVVCLAAGLYLFRRMLPEARDCL